MVSAHRKDGHYLDMGYVLTSKLKWEKVLDSKVLVIGTTHGRISFGELEAQEMIKALKELKE